MTTLVISIREDESLKFAAKRMYERGIRALPVVSKDGRLTGMVAKRHVIKVLAEAGS